MARGGRGPTWYATLDTGGVEQGARRLDRELSGLHSRATAVGTALGMLGAQAVTAGIRGLSSAVRTGWEEMQEAAVAGAKLDAVLKSTHQAAGMNRAAMDALNASLQQHSTVEGDVITNAQALMATFTKVGRETFPGAMKAAMDMSRVFDMDLSRSSVMLGKALQDPAKGISALTRVGVTFTAQQKEQVKALVEAGKVQQAQALILKEVNKQVGGAEERYGRTLPGALEKARRGFKDLAEQGITALEPSLLRAANALNDKLMPGLASFQKDAMHILGADLGLDRKLELLFKRLDQTGAPAAVRRVIEKGIVAGASNGPKLFMDAFMAAPWQGQAIIGAMLVKKFGPAFSLLGQGAGKAIGSGLGTAASSSRPVPVYVVNGGAGLPGGKAPLGGAPIASPGGIAALTRATAGPLALGAGLIVGGMALDRYQQGHGIPILGLPSAKEARAEAQRAVDATYAAAKQGRARLQAEMRRSPLGLINPIASDKDARDVADGMEKIAQVIRSSSPKVRRSAKAFTNEVMAEIEKLPPRARSEAASAAVEMSASLEKKGQIPKGTTRRLVSQIGDQFGLLSSSARRAADDAAGSLGRVRAALDGIRSGAETAQRALSSLSSAAAAAARMRANGVAGRAGGGFTPGRYRGVDDLLVPLAGGEAVLNPRQQAMVPGGRHTLERIFRDTASAFPAPHGFAGGGWVYPAPGATPGGGPGGSGSHSYSASPNNWQSDTAWDLMGHDGLAVVAAHDGVVSGTRPFRSDPRFWGRAVYLDVPGGQLYYKHLKDVTVHTGQRVAAGTVLGHLGTGVNGGPHLHIGATSLSLLSTVVGGAKIAPSTATGATGSSGGHETPAADRAPPMTPLQRITKALSAAGISGKSGAALARSVLASTGDATTSLSDRNAGASLGAGETRRMRAAGYAAAHKAMSAGKSPQDVADAQKEAERQAEVKTLRQHIRRIDQARTKLRARKAGLIKRRDQLIAKAKKAKKPGALRRAAAEINKAVATITVELRELTDLRAEANDRLLEIREDALAEQHQEAYDAAQAAGGDEAGGAATGGDAPSDPGPTESDWLDAQMAEAQLTEGLGDDLAAAEAIQAAAETAYYQAKAAGDPRQVATAARSLKSARDQVEALRQQIAGAQPANTSTELTAAQKALMDYGTSADSWLRAVMGSGDIGARYASAWAGGVNVQVQALHPGDASVLAAIGQAVSRAIDTQAYIPSTLMPSGA